MNMNKKKITEKITSCSVLIINNNNNNNNNSIKN